MYIAQQKRQENICEYLLYMWQIEDLLRATECKLERIESLILTRYTLEGEELDAVRKWYLELAEMMRTEGKMQAGHLDINRIVLIDLEHAHEKFLSNENDILYQGGYQQILPALVQLRSKSKGEELSPLGTAFTAVYGYLTLRLSSKAISEETSKSIKQISAFLATLALRYRQSKSATLQD